MSDGSEQPHEQNPHEVDVVVGSRIRLRRKEVGTSQQALAEAVGLTFQQIQKYENGANRVSSSKLYEIAKALRAPIVYFFEGLPDPEGARDEENRSQAVNRLLAQGQIPDTVLIMGRMTLDQQRYIKNCAEGLLKLAQSGGLDHALDPPVQVTDGRGARKSPTRLKVENLARQPIGSKLRLPYGTFRSPKAALSMVKMIGGSGWADVEHTTTGYTITKISEPKL